MTWVVSARGLEPQYSSQVDDVASDVAFKSSLLCVFLIPLLTPC